jgi:hypothetical protein
MNSKSQLFVEIKVSFGRWGGHHPLEAASGDTKVGTPCAKLVMDREMGGTC